jgi:hypothetical protein
LDALRAKPRCRIETADSVMTEKNYIFRSLEFRQVPGNLAKRNELRAFDAGGGIFPWLANVDEEEFFAAVDAELNVARSDFDI